jgi:HEAT repeat protein
VRDDNGNIRYWAVDGLAYLATDAAIAPLLEVFDDDPSPMIRERAACGLAQSGRFRAAQRRTTVRRLLDFAQDGALDAETRTWVSGRCGTSRARRCLTTWRRGDSGTRPPANRAPAEVVSIVA